MMEAIEIYKGGLFSILKVLSYTWWIVLPVFFAIILWRIWIVYIRTKNIEGIKWKTFEIRVSKEVVKTPKSMEQIMAGLYASYSFGISSLKKYIDGEVDKWMSLEIVGTSGGISFFMHIPEDFQNLMESAVYAQYPEAEITAVDDYINFAPEILPNEVYDIFGMEIGLGRDSYYPIKTYSYFESVVEEYRIDPIAALAEAMSKLKSEEKIWLQILISPTGSATGNTWKEDGQKKIDEITGKAKKGKKAGFFDDIYIWIKNLLWAPVEHPTWGVEKKPDAQTMKFLSPDEQDLVKEIANKISKLGFESMIRFVYIDRQDSFSPANVAAVMGFLQQFNTQNLNFFKPSLATRFDSILARIFPKYKKWRILYRKRLIFDRYKKRKFGKHNKTRDEKFSVLNIEELATLYHFPIIVVGAPRLRRVEAKKGGPPPSLPIE